MRMAISPRLAMSTFLNGLDWRDKR
jgi:hypothetical protein